MLNAKLRIAQIDCTLANFDENLALHCTLAEEAIRDGADAIAFPELSLTGYNAVSYTHLTLPTKRIV